MSWNMRGFSAWHQWPVGIVASCMRGKKDRQIGRFLWFRYLCQSRPRFPHTCCARP